MTPFQILGVPEDATPEQIKAAYRRKAQQLHPDKGGDPAAFLALRNAYERATKPRVCPQCQGKGHVRIRDGLLTKKVPCPRCWR